MVAATERVMKKSANGAVRLPRIEPIDEYWVAPAPTSHPAHAIKPASQLNPKIAPNEVATPLPPLQPSHGEKQCPKTAAIATTAAIAG